MRETDTPIAALDGAATALFRERFDPMVRLAALLTGSTHTAEELVMDAFSRVAPRIGELEHPRAYLRTAVVNAARSHHRRLRTALRDVGLDGEHQLAWLGGGADDAPPSTQVLQVTLMGDDGTEVVVELVDGDQPPWAQALRLRLGGELFSMPQDGAPGLSMSMRPRPDLGPNVVETSSAVPGRPDTAGLVVITDDGVTITVTQAALVENLPSVTPLSEEQQLRIINRLRAMSESEFRAQLSELGAEFLESPPLDGTITTVQGD